MLKPIFPTYLWIENVLDKIDIYTLNSVIDTVEDWNFIKKRNDRSVNEVTDKFGKLWDSINIDNTTVIKNTFELLSSNIKDYYNAIGCTSNHIIDSAWVHEYDENQAIGVHNHRGAQTVGVLYLKNYNKGGSIEFTDPKEYLLQVEPEGKRKEEIFTYMPEVGDIIFFPGYLKHNSTVGIGNTRRVLGFHFYTED